MLRSAFCFAFNALRTSKDVKSFIRQIINADLCGICLKKVENIANKHIIHIRFVFCCIMKS